MVAALSLAIDIGMGQPLEQGLRTCLIASRLTRAAGWDDDDVATTHHVALLRHIGCTASSDLTASFLGDEIAFRSGGMTVNWGDQAAGFRFILGNLGQGEPPWVRARRVANMLIHGKEFMAGMDAVCEVAQLLAGRMGFPERVQAALWQVFEAWDGKGMPGRVRGDAIDVAARAVRLAEWAEAWWHVGGTDAAIEAVGRIRGRTLDPDLADLFCSEAADLLERLDSDGVWDAVVASEPGPPTFLVDDELDTALRAVADFADQKSSWTFGHSPAVAELAAAAALELRLPPDDVVAVRRAGLVHDLGRVGVPTGIWGKAGALNRDDWERIRLHAYHTERALTRPAGLARLGAIASLHHERIDGSGYHRGAAAAVTPIAARVLAVADVYRALSEDRPHRPARSPATAADALRHEVRAGRLDGTAADAVLAVAGQPGRRRQTQRPGDLTDREVDVLRAIARGDSIRQAATALAIAPKTVDAHIQHIYTKLGVSTRAGATLFALQYDLLGGGRSGDLPMAGTA